MRSQASVRPVRILSVLMALLASMFIAMGSAHALPPGGASGNTPGTSSSVSPGSVQAGDYLEFTLKGFPAGSTVSVKFDDGSTCSSSAPQGACVVHQQVVPSSGTLTGSFQVPTDIKKGSHTLRFLTAVYVDSSNHAKGSRGYSNKSPQFQVTGVNKSAKSSGSVSGQQVKPKTAENGSDSSNSGSGTSNSNSGGSNGSNSGSNGSSGQSGSGSGSGGSGSKNSTGSGSGGSGSKNSTGSGSSSGSDSKKTQYVDENGNPISEAEAKKLQEEGKGSSVKEEVVEEDDATAKPSASAAASASASSSADKAQAEDTSSTQDSGSDIPWIGIIAVVLVAVVAAVVLIRRAVANKADRGTGA